MAWWLRSINGFVAEIFLRLIEILFLPLYSYSLAFVTCNDYFLIYVLDILFAVVAMSLNIFVFSFPLLCEVFLLNSSSFYILLSHEYST